MLDADYIRNRAIGAELIAEELHRELVRVIVDRYMARLGRGENFLTAVDKWQLQVLSDAGYLMEDIQAEIAKATGKALPEIAKVFEDAAIVNMRWDDDVYRAAGLEPTPLRQSPMLMRLVQRGYDKTGKEWKNFTGTLADTAQKTFIKECDTAYHLVTSGGMSYTQAVVQAVERTAKDGVVVRYPSGHRDTVETATLRAVRTGAAQACGDITQARMDEMDWDIVLTSAHIGARLGKGDDDWRNHYWWQGRFFSRSGASDKFPRFDLCGYGYVDGIMGANCRHSFGPGDGEFNPYEHFDSEENRLRVERDERMRLLERRIRASRREVMALQEAVEKAPDGAVKAEAEAAYRRKAKVLMRQEKEYDDFCEENKTRKLYDRLQVAQYGAKQARAAEKAAEGAGNGGNSFTKEIRTAIIQGERVPNSITAATPQQKLQGYLLNSNHPRGKDKARVFNSVLGYHYENWDKLSDKLFDGLQTSIIAEVEETRYGIKYKVPMRIFGERGKSMVVNTVWQLDKGSTVTRLVTATFDKRTIRKETKNAGTV